MHKIKECIMCFSEIDYRAKRCPKCSSLQAKYSNLENYPIPVALFFIGIFAFIYYQSFYIPGLGKEAIQDLKININEIYTKRESDDLYISCIGDIKNDTEFKFKDIKFKVDFFTEENELVDTFSITDEDTDILSNTSTNFRVKGIGLKEPKAYKRCIVKITDAWSYK